MAVPVVMAVPFIVVSVGAAVGVLAASVVVVAAEKASASGSVGFASVKHPAGEVEKGLLLCVPSLSSAATHWHHWGPEPQLPLLLSVVELLAVGLLSVVVLMTTSSCQDIP